jgi:hypothetical protein
MWKNFKSLFVLIGLLALAGLACGPGLPDVSDGAGAIATVQSAGQQAGSVAETAVALATQEGSAAIETIQAGGQSIDLGPLQEKFESIQPDANGNFSVTITDLEVNQALQRSQETVEGTTESPLEQAVISFTGGNIILNANVTSPIQAALIVNFRPLVANGVLQFEVTSATLGSVQVPTALLTSATLTLNNTIGQAMNSIPSDMTLQSIVMGEGTMTVSGTRQ